MKPECNDLVNYSQLHFFLSAGLKRSSEEQLPCTKELDTMGNRGPTWSQSDGHKARWRILLIDKLLALMLRATANQPVCGENKAL